MPYRDDDLFDGQLFSVDRQNGKGDFLIESSFAAAARIQPVSAVDELFGVFVGMAEDDHINSKEFRRDELFVVNNEDDAGLNLNGDALRQMLRPLLVVVAADDIKRCKRGKLIENLLVVDVAAMNDGVTAGDDLNDFRAEQAVRVGDNCYSFHETVPSRDEMNHRRLHQGILEELTKTGH